MGNIRLIIYVVVAILLLGSFITIPILWNKYRNAIDDMKQAQKFSLADQTTATWYRNKLDRETIKIKVLDLSNRNLRALRESDRISFAKQFDGIKRNMRNVELLHSANIKLSNQIKAILTPTDILDEKAFIRRDSITGDLIKATVKGDSIRLDYTLNIAIEGAIFWQRKRFLGLRIGRKVWEAQLTSPNPNVRITKAEVIRISRKR